MDNRLRERLRRIKEQEKSESPSLPPKSLPCSSCVSAPEGWDEAGFQTLKRNVATGLFFPFAPPLELSAALPILIPDLAPLPPAAEKLLFFDLETSGLSGGAGTVAFLAAFGRLVPKKNGSTYELHITQYLLLDYPGEYDFLCAVLAEFETPDQTAVTYNGKSFDSQILKTRCLMNGIRPPEYRHADLLHPCRRLWKRLLPDCSQGTIEAAVLGIDRSGDTPGALAPEIWFAFLKTGDAAPLKGICDHNRRDIAGLAAIFAALACIAAEPLAAWEKLRYDAEKLALCWRDTLRRRCPGQGENVESRNALALTGNMLLQFAVQQDCPQAAFVHALDCIRGGAYEAGRSILLKLANSKAAGNIRAAAFRALAIDAERRLASPREALACAKQGMALLNEGSARYSEFIYRVKRLEGHAEKPRLGFSACLEKAD